MTLPLSLTQAQLGCDNIAWFHHTKERVNFWQRKADTSPSTSDNRSMVALWERERNLAWIKLTQHERAFVTKATADDVPTFTIR